MSHRRRTAGLVVKIATLVILAAIFLLPLYWMLSTSFKPESDTIAQPIQWWPHHPTLINYAEILTSPDGNIVLWTWNSVFVSVAYTAFHLLFCALAAYPLARMRFPGRDVWFWIILSSLMVPGIVTLIPTFVMMLHLGWIDTYHALIWPGVSGAFGVFLLRQFFLGVPREMEEAAVVDGASSWVVFTRVLVPQSVPALTTLALFAFMASWNNYVWPLFVVHGDMQTLAVGITSFSSRYVTEYGKQMAGTVIATLPAVAVYLFAQRHLERGLVVTGSKE